MEIRRNSTPITSTGYQRFWTITRRLILAVWMLFLGTLSPLVNAQTQTLTGTINLPVDNDVSGDVTVQINVEQFDANGNFVDFAFESVTIPGNADSTPYEIEYIQPNLGSEIILTFRCSNNCAEVDRDFFTFFQLQDDGTFSPDFNSIPESDFPATQDFQFPAPPQVQTLTGTISLPAGNAVTGDVTVQINVDELDANGNFVNSAFGSVTIPDNADSTPYEIEYIQPNLGNELRLVFSCSNNCAEVDGDFFTFFELQDDGTFASGFSMVPESDFPATQDFQFPEPQVQTLTGTISLPLDNAVSGDVTVQINVEEFDANGNFVDFAFGFVTIPDNADSTPYEIDYIQPNLGSEIRLSFRCSNNCAEVDGGFFTTFELQDDGTFSQSFNSIPESDFPATQDIQFPAPPQLQTLTGTISLPAGNAVTGDVTVQINVDELDANGNFVNGAFGSVTIPDNADSTPYEIEYIQPNLGSEIILSFRCNNNCAEVDGDLFTFFQLQDDGTFSPSFNSIPESDFPATQDFLFPSPPQLQTLTGTISLPAGNAVTGDVTVQINFTESDANGNIINSAFRSVTIPDNADSIPYEIEYIQPNLDSEIRLSFRCNNNCAEVDGDFFRFFQLQDDGTFSPGFNSVPEPDFPATQDFQFPAPPQVQTVTGTISLPLDNDVSGDVTVQINVEESDANGNFFDSVSEFVTIPDNADSTPYEVEYIQPNLGSEIRLSFSCSNNCAEVDGDLFTFFQLQDDGTFSPNFNSVPESDFPATQDFQFPAPPQLQTLTGTISLPVDNAVTGDVAVQINVDEFDANGNFVNSAFFGFVTITDNADSTPYEISYVQPNLGNEIRLTFRCSNNCAEVDGDLFTFFELQDDGTFSQSFNSIPEPDFPATQDFQFPEPPVLVNLSGTISLAADLNAESEIGNFVSVLVLDQNNQQIAFISSSFFIASGTNSVSYSLLVPEVPIGGSYQIFGECFSNCADFTTSQQFLQTNGLVEFGFSEITLAELAFPSEVDFLLQEGVSVAGNILLPEGFSPSGLINIFTSIDVRDGSGDSIAFGFNTVSVPEDIESGGSIPYSISLPPFESFEPGSSISIRYGCERAFGPCDTLIGNIFLTPSGPIARTFSEDNTSFPVGDLELVSNVNGDVDLQLLEGQLLRSVVGLPEGFVSSDPVVVGVQAELFENGTFTGVVGLQNVTIPAGELLSPEMIFSIEPLDEGQQIQLIGFCVSNCAPGFDRSHFFTADGSTSTTSQLLDQIPETAAFELIPVELITGLVSLPSGVTIDSDISVFISLSSFNQQDGSEFVGFDSTSVVITPESDGTASFSLERQDGQFFRINYGCDTFQSDCGDLLGNLFFTPDGIEFDFLTSIFDSSLISNTQNLVLAEGLRVTGEVSLPDGVLDTDIPVFVNLTVLDSNGNFSNSFFDDGVIEAGDQSTDYSFLLRPIESSETLRLNFGCQGTFTDEGTFDNNNCGLLLSQIFFTPDGPVFDVDQASFPSLPAGQINLTLIEGEELSGTIALPSGLGAAENDFNAYVQIVSFDEEANVVSSERRTVSFLQGDSEAAEFRIPIPPADSGSYEVQFGCQGGSECGLILDVHFFTLNGVLTSAVSNESLIPVAALPPDGPLSLVLQQGSAFNGILRLPDGITANSEFFEGDVFALIMVVNESGEVALVSSHRESVTFDMNAQQSNPFEIVVPILEPGQRYVIEYRCFQFGQCAGLGIVERHFFNSETPVFSIIDASRLEILPSDVTTLQLVGGALGLNFETRRPFGLTNIEFSATIDIFVTTREENGEIVARQDLPFGAFISSDFLGSNIQTHNILPPSGSGGFYDISFSCNADIAFSDCNGLQLDAPSYSFRVPADSVPNPIILQLLELDPPPLPDSFEVDNVPSQASIIRVRQVQSHTIHEAADIDWVTFTLDQESTIEILVQAGETDGQLVVNLFDQNETPIENNSDVLDDDEIGGSSLSAIRQDALAAGTYLISIEAASPTDLVDRYTLRIQGLTEELGCYSVLASNGRIASFCL